MKRIALLCMVVALTGCVLTGCGLFPQTTKDQAVSVVKKYCAATTPIERQIIRDGANAELAAEDMAICGIKCPGQPAPVVPVCQPKPQADGTDAAPASQGPEVTGYDAIRQWAAPPPALAMARICHTQMRAGRCETVFQGFRVVGSTGIEPVTPAV